MGEKPTGSATVHHGGTSLLLDYKVASATANGGCEAKWKLKSMFYTEIKVHKHSPFNINGDNLGREMNSL